MALGGGIAQLQQLDRGAIRAGWDRAAAAAGQRRGVGRVESPSCTSLGQRRSEGAQASQTGGQLRPGRAGSPSCIGCAETQ